MDADNIEIVVSPGNWQTPGKAARWKWQVRQKSPPKMIVQGLSRGTEQGARDAARAAQKRFLARVAM
jgi:hypothetical protein